MNDFITNDIIHLAEKSLNDGQSVRLTVVGNSMAPLFVGLRDSVTLKRLERPVKKYDIPLYKRSDGSAVLHTVVSLRGGVYLCRGDAQTGKPEEVLPHQIIGTVVSYTRNGKEYSASGFRYKLYAVIHNRTFLFRKLSGKLKTIMIKKEESR